MAASAGGSHCAAVRPSSDARTSLRKFHLRLRILQNEDCELDAVVALRDAVAYQAEFSKQPKHAATSSSDIASAYMYTCACVCERLFATTSKRRLHAAEMASDPQPHGPTPQRSDRGPREAGFCTILAHAKYSERAGLASAPRGLNKNTPLVGRCGQCSKLARTASPQ